MFRELPTISLLAASIVGCEPDDGVCTDLGCLDRVEVAVLDDQGAPLASFEGTLTLPDGTSLAIACDDTIEEIGSMLSCTGEGFAYEGAPATFALELTSGELSFSGEITPEYRDRYPNGEDCSVGCVLASETVDLLETAIPV